MLYVVGFPVFLLIFFGVLAFFVWKVFSPESRSETRKIFEFYLSANEMLRDDDRRWFGFEVQETIARGESILRSMTSAPPLVHFALGGLYQKIGDHTSALHHLSHAIDSGQSDEIAIISPTGELREYVRLLRRIERVPAESPLTSAAVRSLERARRNRGKHMLQVSRSLAHNDETLTLEDTSQINNSNGMAKLVDHSGADELGKGIKYRFADFAKPKNDENLPAIEKADRQTISEVLHDIYDEKAQ